MLKFVTRRPFRSSSATRLTVLLAVMNLLFGCFVGAARAEEETAWPELRRLQAQIKQLSWEKRHDEAIILAQQALQIFRQNFDPTHPAIVVPLNDLALQYKLVGAYDKAEPLYEEALAISERPKDLGPQHPLTATIRDNLIQLYRSAYADADEKAELLHLRALRISEAARGSQDPQTATSLERLGLLYMQSMADYAKAKPLLERSLEIRKAARELGPYHPDTARGLNNLGLLYRYIDDYPTAERLLNQALEITNKKFGARHPYTAVCLDNLGVVYFRMGAYPDAERLLQQALEIRESASELGPQQADTAVVLNNLGLVYQAGGAYAQAKPLYERALAIRKKELGPYDPDTAISLGNLALLYHALGADAEAERLLEEALAIHEARKGGSQHPNTATALNDLGGFYSSIGAYAKAEPLLKRALAILEARPGGSQHLGTVQVLNNLGALYEETRDFANAESLLARSLAIRERELGPMHPDTAKALNNLAMLRSTTAAYEKAQPLYERALFILSIHGHSPRELVAVQGNLAELYADTQRPEQAILFGKKAVNGLQALRAGLSDMSGEFQDAFLKQNEREYQRVAGWLVDEGRLAEAQEVMRMLKEQELHELLRRDARSEPRSTRAALTDSEKQLQQPVQALLSPLVPAGEELTVLIRKRRGSGSLSSADEARAHELQALLRQGFKEFNRYLSAMNRAFSSLDAQHRQQVQKMNLEMTRELTSALRELSEGAVLLHYVMLDRELKIILTTGRVQRGYTVPVGLKELRHSISELRAAMDPYKDTSEAIARAQALHHWLIRPIETDLRAAGAKTLVLALDDTLRYLPFAALHDGRQWLVQRYALVGYDEAARTNLKTPRAQPWQLRAFGVSRKHGDFPALRHVPQELRAISGERGVPSPKDGPPLLDDSFTEESLKDAIAQQPAVLHIASHFRFQAGSEANSFLLLGNGNHLQMDDFSVGGEYGFQNLDLLTLSACETAMGGGRKEDGREVEAFGALAQKNGAKAVLATLWPVADKSTARLMEEFYAQHRDTKLNKAQMLQRAQLWLMQSEIELPKGPGGPINPVGDSIAGSQTGARPYAHPYFWAPFILVGNWR